MYPLWFLKKSSCKQRYIYIYIHIHIYIFIHTHMIFSLWGDHPVPYTNFKEVRTKFRGCISVRWTPSSPFAGRGVRRPHGLNPPSVTSLIPPSKNKVRYKLLGGGNSNIKKKKLPSKWEEDPFFHFDEYLFKMAWHHRLAARDFFLFLCQFLLVELKQNWGKLQKKYESFNFFQLRSVWDILLFFWTKKNVGLIELADEFCLFL